MAGNKVFYAVSTFAVGLDAILKWSLIVFRIVQIRFKWQLIPSKWLWCYANPDNSLTDFDISSHGQEYSNLFLSESNAFFPSYLIL